MASMGNDDVEMAAAPVVSVARITKPMFKPKAKKAFAQASVAAPA
jgi:hypothetical protein